VSQFKEADQMRDKKIIIGFLVSMSFISCDLFETRTPDDPKQESGNYVPPTVPSIVFDNMINAFQDVNSVNYLKCFADTQRSDYSFSFEPTPQARSKYPGFFDQWTKSSEEEYFLNLVYRLQTGAKPKLEFLKLDPQSPATDSIQYEATYRLTVPHLQSGIPTQVWGNAQFFLIADRSRNWAVHRWIDINDQSDSTWSELKGAFAK
jgi:hypothetical protein